MMGGPVAGGREGLVSFQEKPRESESFPRFLEAIEGFKREVSFLLWGKLSSRDRERVLPNT